MPFAQKLKEYFKAFLQKLVMNFRIIKFQIRTKLIYSTFGSSLNLYVRFYYLNKYFI